MTVRAAAALGAASLVVGLGCGREEAAPVVTATPVAVERVAAHRVAEEIQATGELVAVEEANVAAEVDGRVTRLLAREGEPVEAGQVVLEVDRERRELQLANEKAMLSAAREEIAQAERELRRIRSLHQRQAASDAQLDAAETALRSARARLESAEAQRGLAELALRNAAVTAPFDGIVARRFVSAGDYVSVGQPLFDLVALDPIEVEFRLAEADSGRVDVGDVVDVRVAPYPDEVFSATVHMVSPRIDPATRTLRVKARVDNEKRRLRPGLFARADLGVAVREGVPMIPEQAVLQRSDGSVAYVLEEGRRAARRNIRLGVMRDGLAEVREGIEVGEVVIVRGMSRLVDGAAVEVRNPDGSPVGPPAVAGAPEPARDVP